MGPNGVVFLWQYNKPSNITMEMTLTLDKVKIYIDDLDKWIHKVIDNRRDARVTCAMLHGK
eukprot:11813442-Ditylum_brightwellii.AAC.1